MYSQLNIALTDDEDVLNLKDIEWSEKNIQLLSPDDHQPEAVKEDIEPPRKKVAPSNRVRIKSNFVSMLAGAGLLPRQACDSLYRSEQSELEQVPFYSACNVTN